jgi:hypothetical protein
MNYGTAQILYIYPEITQGYIHTVTQYSDKTYNIYKSFLINIFHFSSINVGEI